MGRQSTGAITTREVLRIELSYLLKQGYLKKGCIIKGILSWTTGNNIQITSAYTKDKRYIKLKYNISNRDTGDNEDCEYDIQLTTIPSNLGRGEIVYFSCPITGVRARILYKCYGSKIWKSRGAYRHRIYYSSQQCSKYDLHNTRFWDISKKLDKCYERNKKSHYQGKETKLMQGIHHESWRRSEPYRTFMGCPRQ